MNIVLVNIYPINTYAWYLLSSYMLKAYIERNNTEQKELKVDVLNFSNITSAERVARSILNYSPDIIGFSCYSWNMERVLEVIDMTRNEVQADYVLGGPEIFEDMIYSLKNPGCADYYIIGEGEESFFKLVNFLYNKRNSNWLPRPEGIAVWNDINKSLEYEKDCAPINLDNIPSVYLTGIIDDRLYKGGQVYIETQRGCKYKCKYCIYHKNINGIRYFSLERVYEELNFLIVHKKVSSIRFLDSIFSSDLKRAKSIVKYIHNMKISGVRLPLIYWEYNYDSIDDEFMQMVSMLKNKDFAGGFSCMVALDKPQIYDELVDNYTVINCIGVQTLNAESLKAIGRGSIDTAKFADFMVKSCKYNTLLKVDVILGLPFETLESYLNGIESLLEYFESTDHVLNIHILQLLPGTDLYKNSSKFGIEFSSKAPHNVISTNAMDKDKLSYASKLSAVLFRVINSPLRELFFKLRNELKCSNIDVLKKVYNEILSFEGFTNIKLVNESIVDDEYWNAKLFNDIPSSWLNDTLYKIQHNNTV